MPGAQRTIGLLSSRWDLHAWHQCQVSGGSIGFSDSKAAAVWLRRFRSDPVMMASLRSLVSECGGPGQSLWRTSDEQVLQQISCLLGRGILHMHSVSAPATAGRTAQIAPAAPQVVSASPRPAASQPQAASPPPKQVEEASTFSSVIDAAATAEVLRDAAATGVPFCEECAKAAAAAAERRAA